MHNDPLKPEVADLMIALNHVWLNTLGDADYRCSGVRRAAETLDANVNRLVQLQVLPADVFFYATLFQQDTRASDVRYASMRPMSDEERQGTLDQLQDRTKRWLCQGYSQPRVGGALSYEEVAGFAAWQPSNRTHTLPAFYAALVVQAWTAFEALAEDLWVDAVDAHPTVLSKLEGRPRSKHEKPARGQQQQGQRGELRTLGISVNALERHGFNVSRSMGKLLLRLRRVEFRSLRKIREAYHASFTEQHAKIDEILDRPILQYASAVRNVLIHKAGKIDDEYRRQVGGVPGAFAADEDAAFPLPGKLTNELARAQSRPFGLPGPSMRL